MYFSKIMDAETNTVGYNRLEKLKTLFNQFTDVVKDIKALHSRNVQNETPNAEFCGDYSDYCVASHVSDQSNDIIAKLGTTIDTDCLMQRKTDAEHECSRATYENMPSVTNNMLSVMSKINGVDDMQSSKYVDETNFIYQNLTSYVNNHSNDINAKSSEVNIFDDVSEVEPPTKNDFHSNYGNLIKNDRLMEPCGSRYVMGVELPYENTFNEKHLHLMLNNESQDTMNYFYYLFEGNNEYDTSNYNENPPTINLIDDVTTGGLLERDCVSPSVSPQGFNHTTHTLGLTDDTVELPFHNTEPDPEASYVDVTTVEDPYDGFVVPKTKKTSQNPTSEAISSLLEVQPRHGCDNRNMFVPTSNGKAKKYCCVYCLKRYSKLVTHLETIHKDEKEVKKLLEAPLGSQERKEIIAMIRKRGQFEWNRNEALNGGELSTCRRSNPNRPKNATEFLSCANCLGSYLNLSRHWKKCPNNIMKDEKVAKEFGRALEGRCRAEACDDLRTSIFPKMREDESVRAIKFDWLVVAQGNEMCFNYSAHYQQQLIRTTLRKAGKLLLAAKSIDSEVADFASLYHVQRCDTVIAAIRKVALFDFTSKKFKSPGTASTLVTLVNAIGDLLLTETMKTSDDKKEREVERFLKVFQRDVRAKINKIVSVQQAKARRQRTENIPSTADIHRLAEYLDRERDACFNELTEKFSYQTWLCLAELSIVSILLFNRRRVDEMQNMECDDFFRREMINDAKNSEMVPDDVKKLIKSRMVIRGKLNRPVPVLLKHSHDACLELLLKHRKTVGIIAKNECVFALPSKTKIIKTVSAGVSLRTFSDLCGADNPSSLRGTKIRKHMASFCGTLNLSDNDVTNIATFMGHADQIHRDIYRHNALEREVVQMTNYLEAAQGNRKIATPNDISVAGSEHVKPIIDLSDEFSDDELDWDGADESSEDEEDIVSTKTTKKRSNNRPKVVVSRAKSNRKKNPIETIAEKTKQQRRMSGQKRSKGATRTTVKTSQRGFEHEKRRKHRQVINLPDECSSDEWDGSDESSEGDIFTARTTKERVSNRYEVVIDRSEPNRKKNPIGTIAQKTKPQRPMPKQKRMKRANETTVKIKHDRFEHRTGLKRKEVMNLSNDASDHGLNIVTAKKNKNRIEHRSNVVTAKKNKNRIDHRSNVVTAGVESNRVESVPKKKRKLC